MSVSYRVARERVLQKYLPSVDMDLSPPFLFGTYLGDLSNEFVVVCILSLIIVSLVFCVF